MLARIVVVDELAGSAPAVGPGGIVPEVHRAGHEVFRVLTIDTPLADGAIEVQHDPRPVTAVGVPWLEETQGISHVLLHALDAILCEHRSDSDNYAQDQYDGTE